MSELDRENEDIYSGLAAGGAAGAGVLAGNRSRIANREMRERASRLYRQHVFSNPDVPGRIAAMKEIWNETGWFLGPDGMWKYEIPEAGAKFTWQQSEAQLEPPPDWTSTGILSDSERPLGVRMQGPLSTFLDFPALYEAYPGLENMQTGQLRLPDNIRGVFNDQLGVGVSNMLSPDQASSTLMHEIQHAVQGLEGFARGGNPEDVANLFPVEAQQMGAHNAYRALGGEVEARTLQTRLTDAMEGPWGDGNYPSGSNIEPYSRFPMFDYDTPSMEQLIYSAPSTMPPQGTINALQLPMANSVRLLENSLPISHSMTGAVPEEALGSTGARLMALLKRAL